MEFKSKFTRWRKVRREYKTWTQEISLFVMFAHLSSPKKHFYISSWGFLGFIIFLKNVFLMSYNTYIVRKQNTILTCIIIA